MKVRSLYYKPLRLWRKLNRKQRRTVGLAAASACIVFLVTQGLTPTMINPAAYTPLLNTIAKGESNGNYNAYFGNAGNTSIQFTSMTVAEVMHWQQAYVAAGNASNAVGRYQFMGTTLAGLVRQQHISPHTRFNEALQDRLAIALIERRGAVAYVEKKITREQFAENLSKEWAALPRSTGASPHASYYAGDGLNNSRVSVSELFSALTSLEVGA